jgi:hypothetical protein
LSPPQHILEQALETWEQEKWPGARIALRIEGLTSGCRPNTKRGSDRRTGEKFRIRPGGKEHTIGDIDCRGCGVVNGIRYPHPHHDGATIRHLESLVHGEAFLDAFDQYCEGGCFVPSIVD